VLDGPSVPGGGGCSKGARLVRRGRAATITSWRTTLPLEVASEVRSVTGTARRTAHVSIGIDLDVVTTSTDAALLLRWRGLRPASGIMVVDLGYSASS
jgi:hypothetical protein